MLQMYLTLVTFVSVISLFAKLLYLLKCEHSTRIQKIILLIVNKNKGQIVQNF